MTPLLVQQPGAARLTLPAAATFPSKRTICRSRTRGIHFVQGFTHTLDTHPTTGDHLNHDFGAGLALDAQGANRSSMSGSSSADRAVMRWPSTVHDDAPPLTLDRVELVDLEHHSRPIVHPSACSEEDLAGGNDVVHRPQAYLRTTSDKTSRPTYWVPSTVRHTAGSMTTSGALSNGISMYADVAAAAFA